ncbi:MAG: bifunctional aspartate kinase/homoserine dehydrogenase I, partial [bacterium]|nr:bifunctional aspartate kinase/homoserine dehydrogenase I [bacterium]
MQAIKILKFGGASMNTPETIERIVAIVKKSKKDAKIPVVVVSAMHGVTNRLMEIAELAGENNGSYKRLLQNIEKRHTDAMKSLLGKRVQTSSLKDMEAAFSELAHDLQEVSLVGAPSGGARDKITSYGERLSARVLADVLNARSVPCEYLDMRTIIVTDDNFGAAAVDFDKTDANIQRHFSSGGRTHAKLQIATGFIAATKEGKTTTIGRGGSDYTACILGAALGAESIEIWAGVAGVMTADPQKVKDALPIRTMSYEEAAEISYFGAKVIHPATMRPAFEKHILICIRNIFDPKAIGTLIQKKAVPDGNIIKGITAVSGVTMISLRGIGMAGAAGVSGRLFGALGREKINVILITQASSEHSISIAVSPADAGAAKAAIESEFAPERAAHAIDDVLVEPELSVIAIIGEGMRHQRGLAGRLFQTLGRNGINVIAIAQGSSELNVSAVIKQSEEIKALNAVHAAFFAPERRAINIFLVGVGLIGSTLLEQIHEQKESLEREHGYAIRLAGVANTRTFAVSEDGINTGSWRKALEKSPLKMDIKGFVEAMKKTGLPESVFVDCTASEDVASCYADVLRAGISVVTPNKRANSGTYEKYKELKRHALKHGVKFLYETNVGAGLPVISTINDLTLSGDNIIKIEAILSGTLSYIFNNFSGDKSFSEIVAEARKLGYTEPDPRSDLDGMDVARKILILAREAGFPLEIKGVKVKGLLSSQLQKAKSIDDFFVKLKKEDSAFEKKRATAEKNGQVLRFIATLEKGKATVSLQAVGKTHPFYSLSGNDNVIAFTTKRYSTTP